MVQYVVPETASFPCHQAGMISDDQLAALLCCALPDGVRLTAIMDSCHSGSGLDLPFHIRTVGMGTSATAIQRLTAAGVEVGGWREVTNPLHTLGDVVLFSGCEDHDTSSDASSRYGAAGGAMTTACAIQCAIKCATPCVIP